MLSIVHNILKSFIYMSEVNDRELTLSSSDNLNPMTECVIFAPGPLCSSVPDS
jgi:hypothetical protein